MIELKMMAGPIIIFWHADWSKMTSIRIGRIYMDVGMDNIMFTTYFRHHLSQIYGRALEETASLSLCGSPVLHVSGTT